MANRRISDGQSVRVTVPAESDIAQDDFVFLDGKVGMAYNGVVTEVGETSEIILETELAEYELDQINAADAFAINHVVYFDTAALVFRSTAPGAAKPTADCVQFGVVTQAKDANDVVWVKRTHVHGAQRGAEPV